MYHAAAGREGVFVTAVVKPAGGVLPASGHMRGDFASILVEGFCFGGVKPHAIQAAGGLALVQFAALHGGAFQHTGGELSGHAAILTQTGWPG